MGFGFSLRARLCEIKGLYMVLRDNCLERALAFLCARLCEIEALYTAVLCDDFLRVGFGLPLASLVKPKSALRYFVTIASKWACYACLVTAAPLVIYTTVLTQDVSVSTFGVET